MKTERDLLSFLEAQQIPFLRSEHPPVYTCAEAEQYRPPMEGAGPRRGLETKNLFLRDEQQRFYLVMTACEKRLDLKALAGRLGVGRLRFGSQEQLLDALGLTPGAVTVLALVNDADRRVTLLVDAQYWPAEGYLCHPMVNTATLLLTHNALLRFLTACGHAPRVVDMPGG